jgi:hypothetical protein
MVEAEQPPSPLPDDDPTSRFLLPNDETEIADRAMKTAEIVIADPTRLATLQTQVDTELLIAQGDGDTVQQANITHFLEGVRQHIDSFDWAGLRDAPFSAPAARAILTNLPNTRRHDERQEPETTQQVHEITRSIADGYLNRRHEPTADWRGSLVSQRTFLQGALLQPDDTRTMTVWFDLMVGKHPTLITSKTMSGRALFDGMRATTPQDEPYLAVASELDWSTATLARLFDKRGEYQKKPKSYDALRVQFTAAYETYKKGIDPTTPEGEEALRQQVRRYSPIISRDPVATDILEIAQHASQEGPRWEILNRVVTEGYASVLKSKGLSSMNVMKGQELVFPFAQILAPSEEKTAIGTLIDAALIGERLETQAQEEAKKRGESWIALPFAGQGIQGYVLMDRNNRNVTIGPSNSLQEQAAFINDLLQKYPVQAEWEQTKGPISEAQTAALTLSYPDATFIVSRREYAQKSELEMFMDTHVPTEVRQRSFDILRDITTLRHNIPRRFSRSITRGGLRHELADHPDMPDVIKQATLRKRNTGGFSLTFQLVPDQNFPSSYIPVEAQLDFRGGTANVQLMGEAAQLPLDITWIFESISLRIFESACCPPISEDDSIETMMVEAVRDGTIDIPGHIVHVGARKATGEPGQYTARAEANFQEAISALGLETGGISLADINRKHREEEPECGRFLTYNVGYESGIETGPATIPPPAKII